MTKAERLYRLARELDGPAAIRGFLKNKLLKKLLRELFTASMGP
jgi:hypothetical protein